MSWGASNLSVPMDYTVGHVLGLRFLSRPRCSPKVSFITVGLKLKVSKILRDTLQAVGTKAMVVGHTPQLSGECPVVLSTLDQRFKLQITFRKLKNDKNQTLMYKKRFKRSTLCIDPKKQQKFQTRLS
ncbi:hypothetical protein F2Q68_00038422 [Brassica cretica]|uniref:Uncharacterized protein n=1 Tax=Brassica cretica TaxID=69181 RepID=A0A8S9MKP5_BRACR|nr:hypothetical protein F2Q68_00038422 [Brassica cretica]